MITELHHHWYQLYHEFVEHKNRLSDLAPESQRQQLRALAKNKGYSYPIHWREVILLPIARTLSKQIGLPHMVISGPQGNSSVISLHLSQSPLSKQASLSVDFAPMNLLPEAQEPILSIIHYGEEGKPEKSRDSFPQIPVCNTVNIQEFEKLAQMYNYAVPSK